MYRFSRITGASVGTCARCMVRCCKLSKVLIISILKSCDSCGLYEEIGFKNKMVWRKKTFIGENADTVMFIRKNVSREDKNI